MTADPVVFRSTGSAERPSTANRATERPSRPRVPSGERAFSWSNGKVTCSPGLPGLRPEFCWQSYSGAFRTSGVRCHPFREHMRQVACGRTDDRGSPDGPVTHDGGAVIQSWPDRDGLTGHQPAAPAVPAMAAPYARRRSPPRVRVSCIRTSCRCCRRRRQSRSACRSRPYRSRRASGRRDPRSSCSTRSPPGRGRPCSWSGA